MSRQLSEASPRRDNSAIIGWVRAIEEGVMGTDYKRDLREQREDERRQAALDADRRADMAPAPRVLRTPRDEVEAYIRAAGDCLRGIQEPGVDRTVMRNLAGGLRWLDRALVVLNDPNVVDGAALLEATIRDALDVAQEGDFGRVTRTLEDVLELLRRRVRFAPNDEIPIPAGGFEGTPERVVKRQAVVAVLSRHQLGVGLAVGEALGDDVIDEIVTAVETGI